MGKRRHRTVNGIDVWPLNEKTAAILRKICTELGLGAVCDYSPCRRARACATRDVLCWQEHRDILNPIINHARALDWQQRVANGENPDVAPAVVDGFKRILARQGLAEEPAADPETEFPESADAKTLR